MLTTKLNAVESQAEELMKKSRISMGVERTAMYLEKKKRASIVHRFAQWVEVAAHMKHERLNGLDAGFAALTKVRSSNPFQQYSIVCTSIVFKELSNLSC